MPEPTQPSGPREAEQRALLGRLDPTGCIPSSAKVSYCLSGSPKLRKYNPIRRPNELSASQPFLTKASLPGEGTVFGLNFPPCWLKVNKVSCVKC